MDQPNHTILIYSLFYNKSDTPSKDLNRISGINRDDALRFLIKLKIAVSRMSGRNIDHPFILQVIATLPPDLGKRLYAMLSAPALGDFLTHPVVINSIIADILSQTNPGAAQNQVSNSELAAAMLDLVMIYNEHHFKTLNIIGRPDDHDLLWEMMLMQNINAVNQAAYVRNGISKQVIFLEFLKYKLGDRFVEFEQRIARLTGINKLIDIPYQFVQLQSEQDKLAGSSNPLLAVMPENPMYEVFEKLELSIDADNKRVEDALSRLYITPFLRLSDHKLYLMGTNDFGLITDKGWQHLLFKLGNLSAYLPKATKFDQFQAYVGLHYIEKFLLANIFQSLNKPGFRVLLSDDRQTPDLTLIQNEKDVFIIEIKSYALHYNVWKEQDLKKLKEHLQEKYLSENTGVVQLHKCLVHLAADPIGLFKLYTPLNKLRIYPVIIYTEPHLGSMAINDYIVQHSPEIPQTLQNLFQSVLPVTMIHYDFFLENLEVVRANKNVLKEAILRYHKNVQSRKATWIKVRSTYNFAKAMVSFDNHSAGFQGLYQTDQNKIFASLRKIFMS